MAEPVKLTCMFCKRRVGLLGPNSARPYRMELTASGVGPVCTHEDKSKRPTACKLTQSSGRKD